MKRKCRAEKGVTIAELLVGIALISILFVVCSSLFVTSWRHFQETNAIQDVHNSAIFAMDGFASEFMETTTAGLIYSQQPSTEYIAFRSARDNDNAFVLKPVTSKPIWVKWVLYYVYPNPVTHPSEPHVLARKQYPELVPAGNPPAPAISTIYAEQASQNLDRARIVARNVKLMSVTGKPNKQYCNVYHIRIETEKEYRGKIHKFTVVKIIPVQYIEDI